MIILIPQKKKKHSDSKMAKSIKSIFINMYFLREKVYTCVRIHAFNVFAIEVEKKSHMLKKIYKKKSN